jgi:hypothetical protein
MKAIVCDGLTWRLGTKCLACKCDRNPTARCSQVASGLVQIQGHASTRTTRPAGRSMSRKRWVLKCCPPAGNMWLTGPRTEKARPPLVGSAAVINHPGQCAAHGERCHWAAVCGLGLHRHTADARLCCAWRAQAKVRKQQRRGASPWLSVAGRVVARLTTRRTVYVACQTA